MSHPAALYGPGVLAAVALGMAAATAQAPRHVVCCELGPSWMQWSQQPDGHWPSALAIEPGSAAPVAGRPTRDLRTTALMLLSLLADGSTLRAGPYRREIGKAARWVRSHVDDRGRIDLQSEPDWILDHAIGTYALSEAGRTATFPPLRGTVRTTVRALTTHLAWLRRPDSELALWAEMIARSSAEFERQLAARPRGRFTTPGIDFGALRVQAERLALRGEVPRVESGDRGDRALTARLLLAGLRGENDAAIAQRLTERGWAVDAARPLASMYYTLTCYRRGGARWSRLGPRLLHVFVRTRWTEGKARGAWAATGEFARDSGVLAAAAADVITLTAYYRYCHLLVVTRPETAPPVHPPAVGDRTDRHAP